MKFEIIFEDNGTYGAAIRIGKEGIFTVGKNQTELRKNIKEAVACACGWREKLTHNHYQLVKFLNLEKQLHAA